jgi:hypothetical protein
VLKEFYLLKKINPKKIKILRLKTKMENIQYPLKFKNIKAETINAIRETIKAGLFKSENTREFKEGLIIDLNKKLCGFYGLEENKIIFINTPFCICNYNHRTKEITLNKPSLISFLHEFKHYYDIIKAGLTTEESARGWSISAYFMATPILCKSAIERGLIIHQKIILGSQEKIKEVEDKPEENQKNEELNQKISVIKHATEFKSVGLNNNTTQKGVN